MEPIKPSKIWERILVSGDLEEINFLLHLVLSDEESIKVILEKLKQFTIGYDDFKVNINPFKY